VNLVVDASALIAATTTTGLRARRLRSHLRASTNHAPYLIDAEPGNLLRRMAHRGALPTGEAGVVLAWAPRLIDHRYEPRGALATAAWALRTNLTFYDALYVALASSLDAVLITADARLAGAPDLPCELDVLG
jgi:predicted nucleic acid-binding protein